MKFTIAKTESDERLDKFLIKHFSEYSRAYLQKRIKSGAVLVNGIIKKPSYVLKLDDQIETNIKPPEKISLEPDASIKLNIIYEDSDVLVIDKPAGLIVHPSNTQKNGTLVNTLIAHYPLLTNVGENSLRPGIVHRLDKNTSGLMIVAKNNNAFEFLKNQFKQRKVEKKYLALVVDKPKKNSGEIKTFFARSKSDPTKQKISTSPTKQEAITNYKTIREFKNFTLLEARPKTGRMHQIRVHLAYIGCPVAGDKKYGRKTNLEPNGLTRQFLHAASLKIALPNGQEKEFKSPLPKDLQTILSALET